MYHQQQPTITNQKQHLKKKKTRIKRRSQLYDLLFSPLCSLSLSFVLSPSALFRDGCLQTLALFVLQVGRSVPGLSGLFISGVMAAALSTISSSLNTLSGTIYEDFLKSRWVSGDFHTVVFETFAHRWSNSIEATKLKNYNISFLCANWWRGAAFVDAI